MNPHVISYVIVAAGAVLLMIAAFAGRYRSASVSVRVPLVSAAVTALGWSAIGLYLLHYAKDQHGTHTTLPWRQFWQLTLTKWTVAGITIGLLIALFANPDFRRQKRNESESI